MLTYDRVTYGSALGTDIDPQHLIDIEISKMYMKTRLTISLSVNDLLDQNKGINRSGNQYSLTESYYNTLGRYLMLGLSYRIGQIKKDDGIMKI